MIIKRISREDIGTLSTLIEEHSEYENLSFGKFKKAEELERLICNEEAKIYGWLVQDNNKTIGYMTATIDYSTWSAEPFVYMDCLYLQPNIRRKGLGIKLMKVLEQFAIEHNCNEIQWQTPPTNEIGVNFYRKLNTKELTKLRFTLSVDT